MTIKNYGLILKPEYLSAADDNAFYKALRENEAKMKVKCDEWDSKVLPKVYKRYADFKVSQSRAIAQMSSGEYVRVYVPMSHRAEDDYMRESAYKIEEKPTDMSKRIYSEVIHFRDDLIQTVPIIDKHIDSWFFKIVPQVGPEVEIFCIDVNEVAPRAVSMTKEYYARLHKDTDLNQEERDWATILGYEGYARDGIKWILETFKTNEERLAFVNGTDSDCLGKTAIAQAVICPKCGRPTFASPNQHAFTMKVPVDSYSGDEEMKKFLTPVQLKCSHCGADLTECFDFDEPEADVAANEIPVKHTINTSYKAWWTDPSYKQVHFIK